MLQLNSGGPFIQSEQSLICRKISIIIIAILINLIPKTQSTIFKTNQPKFLVGFYNLFATPQLTSYPFSAIYNIPFAYTLPVPATYYDLVIALNTYHFVQSNTYGWNFTKSNLSLTGFILKYQAGLNSVIYQLGINYLVIDNDFQQIQIAYFNITCTMLNVNTGYRSENVTYNWTKFKNDSSISKVVFLESFNLTNTQNDQSQFRKGFGGTNLTALVQFYVWGLCKMYDFQFYLIGFNKAYMQDTYQRYTFMTEYYGLYSSTVLATLLPTMPADYKFASRLFTGLSGFGINKVGSKRVEFLLHTADNFNFLHTNLNGGGSFVDFSFLGMYKITCGASQYYRDSLGDCAAACLASQYIDSTHTPSFCRACHYTCATCYDYKDNHCITCSSATRNAQTTVVISLQQLYKCVCNTGYFDRYLANCLYCASYIPACTACSDNSTCTACPVGMNLFNNKCVCNDPNQVYFGATCVNRIKGCQTHFTVGASLNCTQCYVQRNFTINSTFGCVCQDPAHQTITDINGKGQFWCLYKCGDGYLSSNEQCDDSNIANNDGCSSLCTVERNFTCTNVIGALSVCQYNLSTQLIFHYSQRVLYQNTAILNFTLQPYIYYMSEIANISSIVQTTMPVSKIEHQFVCPNLYTSLRCNLTLTVQYTQHLQHEQFMLILNFSTHSKMKYDSRPLFFTPLGNVALISYEQQSTLSLLSTMEIIVLVLTILTITIFLASIYFQKMIGVQLILTVQYIYYILTPIKNNPVELVALQRNLKYSTGFNSIYNYTFYRYQPLPNQLNHQFYEKQFLMNMNIMFFGLLLVMSILIFVKLVKTGQQYCKGSQNPNKIFEDQDTITKGKFQRFYNFYWNKIFFIYVFFVIYQVLFSAVVTTILQNPTETYFSASFNFFAAFLSFFIIIIGILSVGYWYYQGSRKKGRISLQQNQIIPYEFYICKRQYILAFAMIQPIKIWIVAIFYGQAYCYYIVLSVCSIYFIFLAVLRPYGKNDQKSSSRESDDEDQQFAACMSIHNFGICFNQFCVLIISVMCLLWNITINNYDFDNAFPQVILYSAMAIIFFLDVVAVLRIFYKKIGKLLCCQSFRNADANALNADNAFAKMRKIIREGDLKGLVDDTDIHDDQNGDQQKNANPNRKQKMKLLQDIKKAKNFFINWKDDAKPKLNQQDYSSNAEESLGQEQKNGQNLKNSQKINEVDSKMSTMKNRNDKNSGIVEMQTLMKALNQSKYNVAKTSQKKTAQLNKSIIDALLQKKQLQSSKLRTQKSIYVNDEGEGNKKKDVQNLNQVKQRLRKQFQLKKGNFQK